MPDTAVLSLYAPSSSLQDRFELPNHVILTMLHWNVYLIDAEMMLSAERLWGQHP